MAYILANDPNLFKDIRFYNDILIIGVGGLKSQSVFIVVDFFQAGLPIIKDSSYIAVTHIAVHEQHKVPVKYPYISHAQDRKSTRLNSSHVAISYAVFCLKKKKNTNK